MTSSTWLIKGTNSFNNIITGDETRCLLYDPQTQRQSFEWKSSPPPLSKNLVPKGIKKRLCWKYLGGGGGAARALSITRPFQKVKLWIKECTLTSLVALWMRSQGNAPKREDPQLVYPSQCSSTPVGDGQGFISKEQCDNVTAPHTPLTWFRWFLPVSSTAIINEGRQFCGATDIATEELKRRSQNGFVSNMFSSLRQKCIVAQGDYCEGTVA